MMKKIKQIKNNINKKIKKARASTESKIRTSIGLGTLSGLAFFIYLSSQNVSGDKVYTNKNILFVSLVFAIAISVMLTGIGPLRISDKFDNESRTRIRVGIGCIFGLTTFIILNSKNKKDLDNKLFSDRNTLIISSVTGLGLGLLSGAFGPLSPNDSED